MTLFGRKYELSIGKPGEEGFLISELDISFNVKKGQDSSKSQNKLSLRIFNLSLDHRRVLSSKENLAVILKAGYENHITTIFQGKISKSETHKSGSDFETQIEAGDGFVALKESKTSIAFPPNSTALQVAQALCNDLVKHDPDIALGTIFNQEILSTKKFLNGYSACGFTKAELKKLLTPLKMTFSLNNEIIYIAAIALKTQQAEAFLLSKDSGLINSPSKTKNDPQAMSEEKVAKDGINFECLLNGGLSPLNMVKLQTNEINGTYKLVTTEHVGEYLGTNWQTRCFCAEVL